MSDSPTGDHEAPDITGLLLAWRAGDQVAGDQLMQLVYDELKRQAARAMRREDIAHTLQPTALVNEAYLRLVDQTRIEWQNRAQFFGVAAQVMRRILVDHARAANADKRGGGATNLTLDESAVARAAPIVELLALDEALDQLAAASPRQARVIELRYFGGLSVEETAEVLGVSAPTVSRDQQAAEAWLAQAMSNPPSGR